MAPVRGSVPLNRGSNLRWAGRWNPVRAKYPRSFVRRRRRLEYPKMRRWVPWTRLQNRIQGIGLERRLEPSATRFRIHPLRAGRLGRSGEPPAALSSASLGSIRGVLVATESRASGDPALRDAAFYRCTAVPPGVRVTNPECAATVSAIILIVFILDAVVTVIIPGSAVVFRLVPAVLTGFGVAVHVAAISGRGDAPGAISLT